MADSKKKETPVVKSQATDSESESEPEYIKFTVTEPIKFQFMKRETSVVVLRGQKYMIRESSSDGQPEISKVDRSISRQKADWAISNNKAERV